MSDGIYIAMSGAAAQERALDVVANNLANANTVGYRAERVSFSEALTRSQQMSYVQLAGGTMDRSAGNLVQTGNPLDLALIGDGYFAVDTAQGPRYTRAGQFQVDDAGTLVTLQGNAVLGADGKHITIPPWVSDLRVDPDGTVHAQSLGLGTVLDDGNDFGRIAVVHLDPTSMAREGGALYSGQTVAAPAGVMTEISAGTLEESNLTPVRGMVDLVRISRVHEAQHRMIEAYKEINQRSARELGRGR